MPRVCHVCAHVDRSFSKNSGKFALAKRIAAAVVGLGVVGGAGFLAYAWYPSIAPISRPAASSFSPEAVKRGELVAAAGYCAECHTRTDGHKGPEMAGDFQMETPFGNIYSSNITPDPETGIGNWSEAAFKRAMNLGIARDGTQLLSGLPVRSLYESQRSGRFGPLRLSYEPPGGASATA